MNWSWPSFLLGMGAGVVALVLVVYGLIWFLAWTDK